jgi:hypothetical protein
LKAIRNQKVYTKLVGMQYRIIYNKGVENTAADALCRQPQGSAACLALSQCTLTWLQEVLDGYAQDAETKELLSKMSLHEGHWSHFSLQQGIII